MSEKETLPEGWVEKALDELFDFSGGFSASRSQLSSYGYPYLHYGDIHGSTKTFVDVCKDKTIPHLDIPLYKVSNNALLKDGDVVFVDASEDDEGTSRHIVIRNAKNTAFISGLHTIVAKPKTDELDDLFKEFCFFSEVVKSQFKFYAVGTKVTGVNKVTIKKITLKFPVSKSEQRAIAEVLSDMDSYIASLEKLIAKKRAVKQGAMQELLTGKRRLPGFAGEEKLPEGWKLVRLGDKANIFRGGSPRPIQAYLTTLSNGINWIKIGDVEPNAKFINATNEKIIPAGVSCSREVQKGDFILSNSMSFGRPYILNIDGCIHDGWLVIQDYQNNFDQHYLYYALCSDATMAQYKSMAAGSSVQNLSKEKVADIVLPKPPLPEQSAIIAVLSDMDAEIDALSAKLNKTKLIKQGMMRELLTGKIRMVNVFPIQDEFTISEYMVILAIITKLFTDKGMKFLKHMRYQKLVYLYLVYKKVKTGIFEKWDYGPFSKELAYTVVPKAENEKSYIATDNDKNICVGENINEAVENATNKGYYKDAEQLAERIRYKKDTELMVLATVIESIKDLEISQKAISLQTVKEYIGSISIWKPKLSLEYFNDFEITKAIKEYYDFFK